MIGKTISHYKILEKLGGGGMGVVYKARDTRLDRTVAVKFLPPELTRNPEAKKRFIHEAHAASALEHNNICNIHEIDETKEGQTFIVMACYEGEILKTKIDRGPLKIGEAVDIGEQVALGLQKAHEKGIVHRDIKPANIFVTEDGVAKIFDFGLAKLAGQTRLTKTGATMGTAAYMSPEQARGDAVDRRTDIWSLGVVMYEMMTRQLPFKGEYDQAVLYSILNLSPQPVKHLRKDVPPEIEKTIEKCLARNADERYQSMAGLLTDLRSAASGLSADKRVSRNGIFSKFLPSQTPVRRIARQLIWTVLTVSAATFGLIHHQSILEWLGIHPLSNTKHLAIIPLTNVGNQAKNQAFCDGLVEILSSELSQLEEFHGTLWVVPVTDVRKEKITSVQDAKKKFEVNLVITGSVQREDGDILLTLNLVDAKSLRQLRSTVIDDRVASVSMMQNGVLMKLAEMLKIELQPQKLAALAVGATDKPLAFDYYIQGRGYLQNYQDAKNIDTAIELFELALKEDPGFALGHAGLGEACLRKYRLGKDVRWIGQAIGQCNQSLKLNNRLIPVRNTLGLIHLETGRYEEAVREFSEAIQMDSINADAYSGLARTYQSMNRLKQAEDTYSKAVRLRPWYWGGYSNLGAFYFNLGRYSEAVTQFRKVIDLVPESVRGHTNLGAAYFSLERWNEAIEELGRAIQIIPEHRTLNNLATVYFYQQRYDKAVQTYERALELNDKDYRTWGYLAESYFWMPGQRKLSMKNYHQAMALAEKQLQVNLRDPEILSDLASYCVRAGNQSRASILLNQAIELRSSNLDVLFRIAEVFEQMGNREQALSWFGILIDKGYTLAKISRNPSFKDLLSDERFQRLLKKTHPDISATGHRGQ